MMIITLNGDLFSSQESLVHCVGADFRMGMGIAVKFRDMFGQVDALKKQNVKTGGCAVLKVKDPERYIYYLVTKERTGAGCYPTYAALESSIRAMRKHLLENGVNEISMPQIGCGLDRLQWTKVEDIIRNVFYDDHIKITVYKYSPN